MQGYFTCPKCNHENPVEVESYKFADVPPECDKCGYTFTQTEIQDQYLDILSDATARYLDYVKD